MRRLLHKQRAKRTPRTRLVPLVVALGVLGLMVYGERWMLEHPAAATNELIGATCVADVVFGIADPADMCGATGPGQHEERRL